MYGVNVTCRAVRRCGGARQHCGWRRATGGAAVRGVGAPVDHRRTVGPLGGVKGGEGGAGGGGRQAEGQAQAQAQAKAQG
eukprot:4855271-Prymnesium_polylepis.1